MSEQSLEFEAEILKMAGAHGVSTFPEEACGLFFAPFGSPKVTVFVPCQNIQNELHRKDPVRYPRTAKQAYQISEAELQKWRGHFGATLTLRGIFHSHNEVGVYFSEEDRAMAAPWGEALFPEMFYMVLGVARKDHRLLCTGAGIYTWDPKRKDFDEQLLDAKVFETMGIKIRIPTPLQKFTQNRAEIEVQGSHVAEVLGNLDRQFPGMRARLYDDQGQLRRFINFFLNEEDIRFLEGENTPCKPGDTLSIIPAIAGGAG